MMKSFEKPHADSFDGGKCFKLNNLGQITFMRLNNKYWLFRRINTNMDAYYIGCFIVVDSNCDVVFCLHSFIGCKTLNNQPHTKGERNREFTFGNLIDDEWFSFAHCSTVYFWFPLGRWNFPIATEKTNKYMYFSMLGLTLKKIQSYGLVDKTRERNS